MELQQAANLLKKIIQETLAAKIYPYGFADYKGVGNKTASFGLYNSVQTNITEEQGNVIIQLALATYGKYVNLGRAAGKRMVPIPALIDWIKTRGLKGRDKETGRFITNESLAWGIRKNIQKFGIRPKGEQGKGFLDIAINKFMTDKNIEDLIFKAVEKDLDLQLNTIFK
jgi:hypothetical protein